MTLPSTNAVLPIFSCTMRKEFHLILYCPRSSAFVFVCSVDSSNSYLLLISPHFVLFQYLSRRAGSIVHCRGFVKYLWNIYEIFVKYLKNICEILVIYLWNFTIFSNTCTTEVALSSSTENCTAKNWLVYFIHVSYPLHTRPWKFNFKPDSNCCW